MEGLLQILLGPFGTLVLALVILYGGWKKWWVFGWYARAVEEERDMWREQALRGTKIAEQVSTVLVDNGGTP